LIDIIHFGNDILNSLLTFWFKEYEPG